MATALPLRPAPKAGTEPRYRAFGNDLEPINGGPVTRLRFPGDRWSLYVVLPRMAYETAKVWISRLIRRGDTVLLPFPQPGFDTGTPGSPKVNGAGQLGMSLVLDGFTPAYAVSEGQYFSIIIGGQRFLHCATAEAIADGDGEMTLQFEPMLRKSPSDNDVVEVAVPMIEGFVEGRETAWTLESALSTGLSFTIAERE